jgi:putative transcriptional regulator
MYSILYISGRRAYLSDMGPRQDLEVRNHVRRYRRQVNGMTQEELAARVGVTRQTIISIEAGRYNPSVGLALRLASAFGVPTEQLFELIAEDDHA